MNIQVVCRFRPIPQGQQPIQFQLLNEDSVVLEQTSFNFDQILAPGSQEEVYQKGPQDVIKGVLQGFNGTVVAYGQTASGKTFTMEGGESEEDQGIIKRMVGTVFDYISNSPDYLEFRIKISVVELYMEKIRDLLNPTRGVDLKIREDKAKGIYIQEVTETYVSDESEIYDILKQSQQNRQIASTNMNEQSSRSHMLFLLSLTTSDLRDHSARTGKLFLVDLAGSEKVSKTGAEGRTLDEAKGINKSLMALGQVINALSSSTPQSHIPYRSSKLTRLLSSSFGGNSRTVLIITCSQALTNLQETLSTLRFGQRAKTIKNQPKINREYTVEELKNLVSQKDQEIQKLKDIIANSKGTCNENNLQQQQLQNQPDFEYVQALEHQKNELVGYFNDQKQKVQQISHNMISILSLSLNEEQIEEKLLKKDQLAEVISEHVTERMNAKLKQLFYIYRKLHKDNISEQMVSFMSGVDKISNNNDDDIRVIQLQKELIELRQKKEECQVQDQENEGEIYQLKQQLEEEKESRLFLEQQIEEKEQRYKKKCQNLEQSLQNLMKQVYDILMSKQSWQIEYDIINKKLSYKDEKIKELELENIRLSEENQSIFCKYDDIAQENGFELKSFRGKKNKISKTLRGGQHAE